ncbi:hypothetical protein [Pseudoalteromonas sp. MB47]|uniref:hypothetical protein n=1 Tax=Pseudoalteromonas sp. MB47 TaxID=2588452 RepID=UPI00140ABB00|nr:hypothetical protein [Pseudoalteromonas sp. MB47]NHH89258.1 hypothetical protein [Pseudoalteromonas sp. MB47]
MKRLLQKLRLTSSLCHYKYHLTADLEVKKTANKKSANMLLTACFLDRDLFWATTRTYNNTNLLQLNAIIKAEKLQLPPMEGHFGWSIQQLNNNSIEVSYFVIPDHVMNNVPRDCKLIMPLFDKDEERNLYPLSINHNKKPSQLKAIEDISWINLPGLFLNRSEASDKVEKLKSKHLVIALLGILGLTGAALSAYLMVATNYYESVKHEHRESVNQVLALKQEFNNKQQQTTGLVKFLTENPNVLDIFSRLDISSEDMFIDRVNIINTGFRMSGSTSKSATTLLQQLVQSPSIKEAKFTRPVTKNSLDEEVFSIEVVWK